MNYFNEPLNVQELNKLTLKILRSESPGMRVATLIDAYHVVDGNDIISFVVYDKTPITTEEGVQHERRWVVAITLQDEEEDSQSFSKTRGIVSLRWDDDGS